METQKLQTQQLRGQLSDFAGMTEELRQEIRVAVTKATEGILEMLGMDLALRADRKKGSGAAGRKCPLFPFFSVPFFCAATIERNCAKCWPLART